MVKFSISILKYVSCVPLFDVHLGSPFSYLVLGTPLTPSSNVPNIFFTVFVTHTMLPLSRKTAVVLATITAVFDLIISGTLTKLHGLPLVLQVFNCTTFIVYTENHLMEPL